MKILLISHKHPPSLGGMETQSYHIAQGLKREHDVTEIIYKGESNRYAYFFSLKNRVKNALKEQTYDLIHLNDGLMAFILSWLPNYTTTPIVVTFHGLDLIFPHNTYQKKLANYQASHCFGICVSESTYDKAILQGFSKQQLIWIDNGVDHEFSNSIPHKDFYQLIKKYNLNIDPNKDFIMVSIGRAVPRKGFSWFIEHVIPHLPENFKYMVIGPNNVSSFLKTFLAITPRRFSKFLSTLMGFTVDYGKAQKMILTKHLKDQVFFLDKVSFDDLVNLMRSSHLMVMPNVPYKGDMEGFGLVILEANMCGKYVLGANMEGITSAIHQNKNGELLPTQKADQWVEKIKSLASNRSKLKTLGENAAEYVKENFGWQKMVQEYINFFERIAFKTNENQ